MSSKKKSRKMTGRCVFQSWLTLICVSLMGNIDSMRVWNWDYLYIML